VQALATKIKARKSQARILTRNPRPTDAWTRTPELEMKSEQRWGAPTVGTDENECGLLLWWVSTGPTDTLLVQRKTSGGTKRNCDEN
jgi:hypothetical protein